MSLASYRDPKLTLTKKQWLFTIRGPATFPWGVPESQCQSTDDWVETSRRGRTKLSVETLLVCPMSDLLFLWGATLFSQLAVQRVHVLPKEMRKKCWVALLDWGIQSLWVSLSFPHSGQCGGRVLRCEAMTEGCLDCRITSWRTDALESCLKLEPTGMRENFCQ